MMPIMSFVSNLGYVAVATVGAALFVNGQIASFGILSSFFIYIRLFQNPLAQIAQAASNLQGTAASSNVSSNFSKKKNKKMKIKKFLNLNTLKARSNLGMSTLAMMKIKQ